MNDVNPPELPKSEEAAQVTKVKPTLIEQLVQDPVNAATLENVFKRFDSEKPKITIIPKAEDSETPA